MRLQKVPADKKHYDLIKKIENEHGEKIRSLNFMIPMLIQGDWGLYKVHYCYASFNDKYYAELELIKKTDTKYEALLLAIKNAKQNNLPT